MTAPDAAHLDQFYGGETDELKYGLAVVGVPPGHRYGVVERPWSWAPSNGRRIRRSMSCSAKWRRWSEDVILPSTLQKSAKTVSSGRETLVFVHGFNVSFAEAAYLTVQLAGDLEFAGPVLMFSWPSQRSFLGDQADDYIVDQSTDGLATFLEKLHSQEDLGTIHLVAHSMGSQLLARALEKVSSSHPTLTQKLFGQLILAAPDMDVGSFNKKYANPIDAHQLASDHLRSANDNALLTSRVLRMGRPRVGEYAALVAGPAWLDSVDASTVDTSLLGHSYFAGRHSPSWSI